MENCKPLEQYLGSKFISGYVAVKRAEHENFKRVISSWGGNSSCFPFDPDRGGRRGPPLPDSLE